MTPERSKYDVIYPLSGFGPVKSQVVLQRGLAGFRRVLIAYHVDVVGQTEAQNEAFLEELRRVAAFSHPYIPALHSVEVEGQHLLLLGELCAGATLAELAAQAKSRSESLPVGFVIRAVIDAAHALHYAHHFVDPLGRELPVAHGDLSDSRLLVTFEGTVKILGFGIPRSAAGRARESQFYSPEQRHGDPPDERSDVFSLGALLHALLTGQAFRYGERFDVPSSASRNPAVPREVDVVLAKALSRSPAERHDTALDFALALEGAANAWSYDDCAERVQHDFIERREEHRLLVESVEAEARTANLPLSQVLHPDAPPISNPGSAVGGIASVPTQPRHERPGEVESRDDADADVATDLSRSRRREDEHFRSARGEAIDLSIQNVPTRAMPTITETNRPNFESVSEVPTHRARPRRSKHLEAAKKRLSTSRALVVSAGIAVLSAVGFRLLTREDRKPSATVLNAGPEEKGGAKSPGKGALSDQPRASSTTAQTRSNSTAERPPRPAADANQARSDSAPSSAGMDPAPGGARPTGAEETAILEPLNDEPDPPRERARKRSPKKKAPRTRRF